MPVRKRKQLGCLPKSKYDIIVAKLNGTFDVPIKERTSEQVKSLNMMRKRKDFELDDRGSLLCGGKQVLVKEDLPRFVKKIFIKNKGCGPRVIYNKLKENYTGFSEQAIIEIIYSSKYYHEKYPRFTNKPRPKTVTENEPGKRWQIDLINMRRQCVNYKGSAYNYILQIVDVYSRYVMPKPLKTKSSREVAKALEEVLMVNLAPDIIQCDNGQEFKGSSVKLLLKKYNIKMINSSPYHPQSQGKCERSNSVIKGKIVFASRSKRGFNWVEGLQDIAYAINTSTKRVLGGLTPFEAYYGRSHVFTTQRRSTREIKQTIQRANRKVYKSLMKNAISPSKYKVGEKVLIRYPFRKSRVPTKRFIVKGKVEKVKQNENYLVSFKLPNKPELGLVRKWVRVENITSLTISLEKERKTDVNNATNVNLSCTEKKNHRNKYYQVLTHNENLELFDGVDIAFDPIPDGNCQFSAISHQLSKIGLYNDIRTLRHKAVHHITENRYFYESFVYDETFDTYIDNMSKDGTYGDNLTLIALMREYNLQCLVVSSQGLDQSSVVSADGRFDSAVGTIALGYFPEGFGMHYVSINMNQRMYNNLISSLDHSHHSDYLSDKYIQNTSEDVPCVIHDDVTSCETSNSKRGDGDNARNTYDSGDNVTESTAVRDLRNIINNRRAQGRKAKFPFLMLPIHLQIDILKICIRSNPAMQFVLAKVGEHFRELIETMGMQKPRIYIAPDIQLYNRNPVSVRYLLRRAGRNSGLILAIREIIKEPKWANAWLRLRRSGIYWYDITNIIYN